MLSTILIFTALYLLVGFIVSFIMDTFVRYYDSGEPFDSTTILLMMFFWPIGLTCFLKGFFNL